MFELSELTPFELRTTSLRTEAETIVVADMEDAETARLKIKECTALEKEIEDARTAITKPVNEKLREINNLAKQVSLPVAEAKNILTKKINDYMSEQERIRQEKLATLNREVQKIKSLLTHDDLNAYVALDEHADNELIKSTISLQKANIDAEIKRKEEDDLRRKEQEALKAKQAEQSAEEAKLAEERMKIEQERRDLEAEKARIEREKIEAEQNKAMAQTVMSTEEVKVKGTRTQTKWEIEDEKLVPRELCSPDSKKVNERIKTGVKNIPWLRIWEENIIR